MSSAAPIRCHYATSSYTRCGSVTPANGFTPCRDALYFASACAIREDSGKTPGATAIGGLKIFTSLALRFQDFQRMPIKRSLYAGLSGRIFRCELCYSKPCSEAGGKGSVDVNWKAWYQSFVLFSVGVLQTMARVNWFWISSNRPGRITLNIARCNNVQDGKGGVIVTIDERYTPPPKFNK